ncbi:P2 family phage major capsid protein [Wohlfahrtiimonas larvae]|uniref:Phage major capsid protein, P2 family n=2 Tax=Wohlfahrtiimonas larvae TaxID=1157986 RepID=A0ABP9N0G5_9GAMM
MALKQETINCLNAYADRQAEINNVSTEVVEKGLKFAVTPQVQYEWAARLSTPTGFLSEVDIDTCEDQIIEQLGFAEPGLVSSTTDTKGGTARDPSNLGGPDAVQYTLVKINHDTYVTFDELNKLARKSDQFQVRLGQLRLESKRLDIMRIGFNGVKHSKTSDKKTYPLGQDVAIGWLQRVRDNAPEHNMTETVAGSGKVKVGKGQKHTSIDQLVVDAVSLIPEQYRSGLKIYVSNDLMVDRQMKLIEKSTVTEIGKEITQEAYYTINGLTATTPAFFPSGTLMITAPKNLAIRIQEGSQRSSNKVQDELDRYVMFSQANECFAVKNYEGIVLVENIVIEDASTGD